VFGLSLPSIAGQYMETGAVDAVYFWDPKLAGEAMIQAGWTDKAVSMLNKGYEVAASKGDLMPRDAIAELLKSIGREPPKLSQDAEEVAERLRESGYM